MLDLDPSALEVVFETAPRSHALALKNFFHGYLTSNASMGVSITVSGRQNLENNLILMLIYYHLAKRFSVLHIQSSHSILCLGMEFRTVQRHSD